MTRDLMLRFASLGDNCELGVAQERQNANPMDLFRWAATPTAVLIRLLRENFEAIGENLTVEVHGPAFMVTNHHCGYSWHDWKRAKRFSAADIAERDTRRLPAMAAKLRREMRAGSRIFVVNQGLEPMSRTTAEQVHQAMSVRGKPLLLYVNQGAPVSVTEVAPRLFNGTVPEFDHPDCVPATVRVADWAAMCQMTAALADERSPELKPVPPAP